MVKALLVKFSHTFMWNQCGLENASKFNKKYIDGMVFKDQLGHASWSKLETGSAVFNLFHGLRMLVYFNSFEFLRHSSELHIVRTG